MKTSKSKRSKQPIKVRLKPVKKKPQKTQVKTRRSRQNFEMNRLIPTLTKLEDKKTELISQLTETLKRVSSRLDSFIKTDLRVNEFVPSDWENLPYTFKNIDADLMFVNPNPADNYSPRHIEPLLDRAVGMLERAMSARQQWDELAAKSCEHFLALQNSVRLGQIAVLEIASGICEKELDESRKLLQQAESKFPIAQTIESEHAENFENEGGWTKEAINQAAIETDRQASYSTIACYSFAKDNNDREPARPLYIEYNNSGKRVPAYKHVREAATAIFRRQVYLDLSSAKISLQGARSILAELSIEKDALEKVVKREISLSESQIERLQAAKDLVDARASVSLGSGVLNHSKRLNDLYNRFTQDAREAYLILAQVSQGMEKMFGYSQEFPSNNSDSLFDQTLMWARNAGQYLLRSQHYEQSLLLPISVRNSISENNSWEECLRTKRFSFTTQLPRGTNWRLCRLRGISAFIYDNLKLGNRTYRLQATPPDLGTYTWMDGRVSPQLSQTMKINLGRVFEPSVSISGDIYGTNALYNVSPWGEWTIEIGEICWTGSPLQEIPSIEDIHLELHLVYCQP